MTKGVVSALVICAIAAALEGLLAGRGVKRRLAELRQPPHSPSFAVWIGIGLCYYLICFVVLSRLIDATPSPPRCAALVLVSVLLLGNAVWSLIFFRQKNVEASAIVSLVYAAVALMVMVLLVLVDQVSAWMFLPYVIYLSYATWWVLTLRSLNRGAGCEVP